MNEGEVAECPKCGGKMESGEVRADFRILKQGDLYGDRTHALYCRDCGFVELYKEASSKESRRWRAPAPAPELEQAPTSEELQKPGEEEPKRRADKRLVR